MWRFLGLVDSADTVLLTSSNYLFLLCFQGESVKNSSGTGDEAQATYGGRTRSVRSLGTAELIRPQRLKYFESMCHFPNLVSYTFCFCCLRADTNL